MKRFAAYRWLAVLGAATLALSACKKKHHDSPDNWVLVVNNGGSISLLDASTGVTHGPYLQGQLGKDDLFDAAVTPDGRTALISSFGDSRVYFVDLTDLAAPAVLGNVALPFFAEDVTISPDGKYALVTDGGFSPPVLVLDVQARTLLHKVQAPGVQANASAIARGGTVITTNYMGSPTVTTDPYGKETLTGGSLSTWLLDGAGGLTHANDYRLFFDAASGAVTTDRTKHSLMPVNVAVAPDGVTVIVPDVASYTDDSVVGPRLFAVAVYRITAPGELTFQSLITGLPRAAQSVTFSADGEEAYLLGNAGMEFSAGATPESSPVGTATSDRLLVLRITGPGEVSWDDTRSADLGHTSGSQLFGVDNVVTVGGKVFASYSTLTVGYNPAIEDPPLRVVTMVDLDTFQATRIPAGLAAEGIIAGVAVVPRRQHPEKPTGPATCAGFCGTGNADQGCLCDAACAEFGDCCEDYATVCTACDPTTCTGGQQCVNKDDGTYACGCLPGQADDGAGNCVDVDECTAGTATCKAGATCENAVAADPGDAPFSCTCPAEDGFVSDGAGGCQCGYGLADDGTGVCAALDPCAQGLNDCRSPATCTVSETVPTAYTCECALPLVTDEAGGCTCPTGYQSDGAGGCVDVDECATGAAACNGTATCRNADGRYYCDCTEPETPDGHGGCTPGPI